MLFNMTQWQFDVQKNRTRGQLNARSREFIRPEAVAPFHRDRCDLIAEETSLLNTNMHRRKQNFIQESRRELRVKNDCAVEDLQQLTWPISKDTLLSKSWYEFGTLNTSSGPSQQQLAVHPRKPVSPESAGVRSPRLTDISVLHF
jgi:hypothetical protein